MSNRPLGEPVIPQAPKFEAGGKTFAVLPSPVASVPAGLIPVTSWSRNRKHLAHESDLKPCALDAGRWGVALCNAQIHTTVYDQDWLDEKRSAWFGKPAGSQLIVDLPPCKRCEKKASAATRGEGNPE